MRRLMMLLFLISACAYEPVTETADMMGTYVSITVYSEDQDKAGAAISEAFEEISRIEKKFTEYGNSSLTYEANSGIPIGDEEFVTLVKVSLAYYEISEGAFDITVKPVLDLYTKSFSERKAPPSDEEINEALKLVGSDRISIDSHISLPEGMKVTFGGIAKGYAVDRAIIVLRKQGIEDALVNIGGNMRAIGKKGGTSSWNIALVNPDNKEEYVDVFILDGLSVATSGNYERYFDPEKKFHHIINPKTGYSSQGLISATVVTKNALDADALSTSVFVLGMDKSLELIESLPDTEALIITEERDIKKSSGWR